MSTRHPSDRDFGLEHQGVAYSTQLLEDGKLLVSPYTQRLSELAAGLQDFGSALSAKAFSRESPRVP